MSKPAIAYEPHVIRAARNPASRFARLGPGGLTALRPPRPLAYEVREGVPLLDLTPTSCRWPVGEPRAGLFCGCDKTAGRQYCEEHASKARERPVDPREVETFVDMVMRIQRAGKPNARPLR